jgi:hypothetical protein
MATCEFHAKYADYLTEQVAVELINSKGQNCRCWEEVWCTTKRIALCKNLEQITSGEAENLNLIVFKLYPQFEGKIRAELAEQFK